MNRFWNWLEKAWNWLCRLPWREIFARLPLPMLALAASYGVYSYALLFVPEWVAIIQAAAFEATYIGLAVTRGLDTQQRQKATLISITAVVVSVVYNSLAGLFHRQPDLLQNADRLLNSGLAFLHGAPLAIVAYYVADLLLHSEKQKETLQNLTPVTVTPVREPQPPVTLTDGAADSGGSQEEAKEIVVAMVAAGATSQRRKAIATLLQQGVQPNQSQLAREWQVSRATIANDIKAVQDGYIPVS